jgi:hypothetical protein
VLIISVEEAVNTEKEDIKWQKELGIQGAAVIRKIIEANMHDYNLRLKLD